MTYSIAVFFDEETENKLRRVWQVLAELKLAQELYRSQNRPHITLSIYEDLDLKKTANILCALAGETSELDFSFTALGFFPRSFDIFLVPSTVPGLWALEGKVARKFQKLSTPQETPRFSARQWTAHCSMALEVQPELLMPIMSQILKELTFPLNGKMTGLGLTSFPPVEQILYCPFEADVH